MDVIVVGAGIIGVLTAWELRGRGHRVTVISEGFGERASWAAAGMLGPVSEVQYGQDRLYPIMLAARAEYPGFLRRLERATPAPHGYRPTGTLLIAADHADRQRVAELAAVQRALGTDVRDIPSAELRSLAPALRPGLAGAFLVPSDHQVDPRLLIRAVRDALAAALPVSSFPDAGPPAKWVTDTVTRLEHTGAHWELQCRSGERRTAESVVLAAGLAHEQIAGVPARLPLDLRPVHGDVLRLRLRPGQLAPGEAHLLGSTVRATVGGRQVYLVPRADGGLVIGASVREDGLDGVHAGAVSELLEDGIAVLPAVREMELTETTARARPSTPDDIPYLGHVPEAPGLVVSNGYSRHGILLAPLAARLGAGLLEGTEPASAEDRALLSAMDPRRLAGATQGRGPET